MTLDQRAERIAKVLVTFSNPYYVAGTAHQQERVVQEATAAVLRELQDLLASTPQPTPVP